MTVRRRLLAVVAAALAALTSCSESLPAAAQVGPAQVTENQLGSELSALAGNPAFVYRLQVPGGAYGDGPDGFSSAFVAEILTNEIDTTAATSLLRQRHGSVLASGPATALTEAAFRRTFGGLELSAFPAAYRDVLVQRTAVDFGLAAIVNHVDLSLVALTRYRDAHLAQFATYCVSAILRPSRAAAAATRRQVAGGAAVAPLAKRESLDSSAAHGGRLGCGRSGKFDTAFTHYLLTGPIGAISPPIHDPRGWYLLEVTARHVRTVDQAATDIVTALLPARGDAVSSLISSYLRSQRVTVAKIYGHFNSAASPPAVVAPTS